MAKRQLFPLILPTLLAFHVLATQSDPLASRCSRLNLPNVVCVNKYAAVMPLPFSRPTSPINGSYNPLDRFSNTSVPDPSFPIVRDAQFLVFDEGKALEFLGEKPGIEIVLEVEDVTHEAPVYVPELNAIIVSALEPHILSQQIINLNDTPPTIDAFTPNPPIYGVNGCRYFNGTLYWAVNGGDATVNGTVIHQAPGIYAVDPISRESKPILNNYFGQRFNSPDDLVIDSHGDIYFTDPAYGVLLNFTQLQPVLHQQTYRFRPSTGAVSVIEADIAIPNGITLSPDEKTMYITDTGITNINVDPNMVAPFTYSSTGPKCVYAFDTVESPAGKYLIHKRPIWYPEEYAEDGFHVASNGLLIGASGFGVNVLSPEGVLVLRIQTDFIVNNAQFAGEKLDELWLFGPGKVGRVRWNLRGLAGGRS